MNRIREEIASSSIGVRKCACEEGHVMRFYNKLDEEIQIVAIHVQDNDGNIGGLDISWWGSTERNSPAIQTQPLGGI